MFKQFSATDFLTLTVLILASAMGAWKVSQRVEAAGFSAEAVLPRATQFQAKPGQIPSPDGNFWMDTQFVSAAPGQAVHAASAVELINGDLRAVWFSGSREGAGDVTLQTAVMDVATGRWGAESKLMDRVQLQRGLQRYVKKLGNPVIGRASDGSLLLWMVNVSLGGWAGSSISWVRSEDEGRTWSLPRRLITSPFLNISTLPKGAPVRMTNGQIALPVYHEFFTKLAEMLVLDPVGKVVKKVRIPGSQTNLQPVVLVSNANNAQIFMRSGTAKTIMTSTTNDAGKSWSISQPTSWPNPDSAVAGVATSGGQQWLAINPGHRNREQLILIQTGLGKSFDGQASWRVEASVSPGERLSRPQYESLLGHELGKTGVSPVQVKSYVASAMRQLCQGQECSQEFSYPFLLQGSDGSLHLLYTWHRTRIKHVRLDPQQPPFATFKNP